MIATIMAVACFVFVLPMPDNVDLTGSSRTARMAYQGTNDFSGDQLASTQGAIDATFGGKVSTALMPLADPSLRHDDPGWILVSVRPVDRLRVASFEPPIRPG